ncbi:transcriptional regulator, BadM/Rrf2 family [Rhodomicrobium vannielii ATCC 17100]|jgi:Rrf2 family protein|uniref:Transcriptional regulator, BadM/Rrf2 family n=1 Tax=Rhodomicrobium vannielii (strain ATCC 17100 / DSM 162 / LMG 4299 / NCIMB 10020 / ATH 3.1.1) TaxID=648757 RepID=E3I4V9_RHOVT|nr:Rrf2 family transcriptional regulator [Rhodomicrobium vannielii]ADP72781.1 transcriptional regulator, BadM/Rrf2 family [Rhodomicrobium vannielii ATCC 17100]
MLSAKCKYGLKAMVYIARRGDKGPVLIAEIAEAENIPKKFLDVILLELKVNGMLTSKKGKGGGYQLARRPGKITVADIVRVLGGPNLAPVPCVSKLNYRPCTDCRDEQTCVIRSVMLEVRDAIAAVLENVTLEEMSNRVPAAAQVLMFDI